MGLKKVGHNTNTCSLFVCLFVYRYDEEHNADDKVFLDCFCKIAAGIKNNSNGHQLKDLILQKGITQSALDYMKKHIPSAKKYVLLVLLLNAVFFYFLWHGSSIWKFKLQVYQLRPFSTWSKCPK